MTISSALYSSFYGLRNAEGRINVVSQNVTNADKPGYTRKELESQYITTNAGTVPINSTIQTVDYNPFMLKTLVDDTSIANKNQVISAYLNSYADKIGSIDGDNSLSSYIDDMASAMDQLALTPEDTSLKNQVIASAERVANELNRLSTAAQEQRLKADNEIEKTVLQINSSLSILENINLEITEAQTLGRSTANLIDERNQELENLSSLIDVDYFINKDNKLNIYTAGRPLLDSSARLIEYTANTAIDKNTIYPAGFNSIDLDGFDITAGIRGGELAGLIESRDSYMVEEQSKLDEFASVLSTQMNALLNEGASVPGRPTIVGELSGLTPATALGATGIIRISTTDNNSIVQDTVDLNLIGSATVADLINNINTTLNPNVTASLTTDGQLQIVANNAGEGIIFNQRTSSFPSGENFSTFFGLNNMFNGTGADDIEVSQYLIDNGDFLSTSRPDNTAGFVGRKAVNIGDSSLTREMHDAFTNRYSFNAAGNFAAQSENINNYIQKIISDVAYRGSNAESNSNVTKTLMDQTKTALQNLSGVNIDEEMANLIDLEAKYEASATMIKTLQEMFDTLLSAVR